MDTRTQNEMILNHLKNYGSITPLEALQKYGVFRLSARIYDLRLTGHGIKTFIENNNGKRFAKYVYMGGPNND